MSHHSLEQLEIRRLLSASVRPITEVGNNLANPNWGIAGADLIRLAATGYADGIDSPALPSDLSARAISNILNNQADPSNPTQDIATIDQNSLSDFGYAFGQFMDHDMDLTPDGGASFPIPVSSSDPIGPDALPFTRSQTDPDTGTSTSNPAQQVTEVTAYLDLSQVYGSTTVVANALRTFKGGLLKTSPGNMLPYDNATYFTTAQIAALNMANDAQEVTQSKLFATGDVRGNENIELTTLQTLFMRNHNLIATKLQKEHPSWGDEQLYQEARKINIAEYQSIVYSEWIPAVYGQNAMSKYTGYDSSVNPTISNEFSTVAYRFGHSMVSGEIERQTNNGQSITDPAGDSISLATDFFDPNFLNPAGVVDPLTGQTSTDIGVILKGDADGNGQAMDMLAINDIRNLLFGNGGLGGEDLIARDVQRDRDNGIPDYNTLRVAMGLPAVTSFSQITSNVTLQHELEEAYPGGVNTIDAFEGGMAEDHVKGSDVGPLFQAIMIDQFTRLRAGDRFFYLNENLNRDELKLISSGNTLTKVIEANTNITNLQSDAFLFRASVSGTVFSSANKRGSVGRAGVTVELEDADGDVVATTITNHRGNYSFNQLSGPAADLADSPGLSATGQYKIVVVSPTSGQTAPAAATIDITRGDTALSNVNFSLAGRTTTPPALTNPQFPPSRFNGFANNDLLSALSSHKDVLDKLLG
jgi:peroxidase